MLTFKKMLRDESGAAAAEYALILAIVGGAIAVAAVGLGDAVSSSIGRATDCINNPPAVGDDPETACETAAPDAGGAAG